jgi:alpha-tubulin suppressor-like RCC1 family protein
MWGDNTNGLLGDNRTLTYFSWSKISSGGLHTVAIRSDGLLFAWGRNTEGQLGDTTTIHRSSPVQLSATISWNSVSAGLSHTVAIKGDSTLWVWGGNRYGQLGDSTTVSKSSWVQVGTSSWNAISAGGNHTTGIKIDNSVFAWGFNGSGQLGDSSIQSKSSPVQVGTPGLTNSNAYSLSFNGVNQYLSIASNVALALASGDFTVEFWINPSSITQTGVWLFNWNSDPRLQLDNATLVWYIAGVARITSGNVLTANTWTHIALIRLSGTTKMYADGVQTGSSYTDATNYGQQPLDIGYKGGGGYFGYLSNIRIVKGTAVAATVPPSTIPLTAITNTSLLTAQNTTVVDNSSNAFTITNTGGIGYSVSTPFTSFIPAGGLIAISVNAGKTHTVAIATTYKLWSWGDNTYGELGDSTTINRSSPVQIGTSSWSQVSAGGTHTAAITTTGSLYIWGYNNYGQLGLNTFYSGSYYTQVSEGPTHTLAIRNDGALFVWGRNQLGQLGLGDTLSRSSPVQLGTSSWTSVDAGNSHSVAVRSDGKLFTWGSNDWGQLGNNLTNTTPSINIAWSKIVVSSSSIHTMAIKNDGTLWGWGQQGSEGRIGDGATINRSSPVQVGSLNTWIDVAVGSGHSMGITNDNVLYTWGINNFGQLGDGTVTARRSPVVVGFNYKKVFAGYQTSLAIDNNNLAYIWGDNTNGLIPGGIVGTHCSNIATLNSDTNWSSFTIDQHILGTKTDSSLWTWGLGTTGQLGLNDLVSRSSPTQIGTSSWSIISAGLSYSVGITNDNSLYAWGFNSSGQLGLSDTINRSSPTQIGSATRVIAGNAHTLMINSAGNLYTWGLNQAGQLGDTTVVARSSPVQVGTDTYNFIIAGTSNSTAIRSTDSALITWGSGINGQLADNTNISRSSPLQVGTTLANQSSPVQIGNSSYTIVSAGEGHTLSLGNDGILYGWGKNDQGQIGGQLNTLGIGWSKVVIGPTHSLGIRFDGTLYAWGDNSSGQLGDRTVVAKSSPVVIDSTNNWKDIAVGQGSQYFSMAIRTDGKLYAWGNNQGGQLGWVSWRQISVGGGHSLLLRSDGALYTMGTNTAGQLGDATIINKSSPVLIGTSSWSVISAGVSASAAIDSIGRLFTWGNANLGQIGLATTANRSSPVQVASGSWSQVAIKDYTLAITSQGSIWSWGNNNNGQLGLGTTVNSKVPKLLDGSVTSYAIGFDGIGDSLTIPTNTAFVFGTGNFTIESWFYITSGTVGTIFDTRSGAVGITPLLYIAASALRYYINGGDVIVSTTTLSLNTWYHVALVRNSGSSKMYLNGVQTGSTYVDTNNFTLTNTITIGRGNDGANSLNGYISNLRVVKGQALYTSSFTPSTTQLTTTSQGATAGNVSLLTAQSATIIDNGIANSGVGFTLTSVGTPTTTQYNPFSIISSTGSTSWTTVSAGTNSLAIRNNGTLYTWGQNIYGQLGDSTTVSKSSPIQIAGSWSLISSSNTGHNLAIKLDGSLFAWGRNTYGELGINNEFINVSSPTQIGSYSYTSVSAGNNNSLAIALNGTNNVLYGWGLNDSNQLNNIAAFSWRSVQSNAGIQANIGSNIGKLYLWGDNTYGQLGDNTLAARSSPTQLGGFSGNAAYKQIITTPLNTVIIGNDNSLSIMGDNTYGQLGQGDTISRSSPVQVGVAGQWSAVAISGTGHVLAISSTGTLFAWGNNQYNELGQSDLVVANRSSPVNIGTNGNWTKVSAGNNYSLAIIDTGALYTWGRNDWGQLGTANPLSYTSIGAGIVSRNDGKLYTWGYNLPSGQLGTGDTANRSAPTQISGVTLASVSWTSVAGSINNRASIRINSTLWAWGDNTYGQLGQVDTIPRSNPVQIGISSWTQVYVNVDNIFAIRSDGKLFSWGNNNIGQLGTGDTVNYSSPVQIGSDSWTQIVASGTGHTLGLKADGTLYAWGNNQYNELGQNQFVQTNRSSPVQVGTSSWTKVSAGNNNSFAIRTDGSLWGWGRNDFGQIGTSTNVPLSWTQVAGGDSYSVAIRSDGKLFSWGRNDKGQLGLGHTVNRGAPTQIAQPANYNYFGAFSASPSDSITAPSNANFAFASGQAFTVEGWWYWTALPTSGTLTGVLVSGGFGLTYNGSAITINVFLVSTTLTSTFIPAINTWYHIAYTRNSSNLGTLWANGVSYGSTTDTNSYTATGVWSIYGAGNGSGSGYFSNVRVVRAAVYTSSFTPSTTPLTNIANTVLLTAQSSGFIDNSTASNTLTPVGTGINITTFTPFIQLAYNYSWTQVSATLSHTVAIRNDGTLWAWGANNGGQLGTGDTTTRSAPIQIGTSTDNSWTSVSTGNDASFAIRNDYKLFSWGDNTNGLLGQGNTTSLSSMVQVGSSSWTSVSATQHAIGITTANTMYAWGLNTAGQLGDNTTVNKSTPTIVQAGFPSSLLTYNSATTVDNSGNAITLTATGSPTIGNTVIPFSSTYSVNFPSNTYYTTGTLPAFGTQFTIEFWVYVTTVPPGAWYWYIGATGNGPLLRFNGNSTIINSIGKVNQGGGAPFDATGLSVTTNTWYHIAYTRNSANRLDIWLNGTSVGNTTDSTTFAGTTAQIGYPAGGNSGSAAGYMSNFRLVNNACLYNASFTPSTIPLTAFGLTNSLNYTKSSAGNSHSVALRNDSGLYVWGNNAQGQIGNSTTTNRSFATQIGASSWTQINAGASWTLGVLSAGGLYSWGAGANGELGNGTTSRSSPVQIGALTTWGVLTGKTHALSITTAGALFAWGTNTAGQLGNNSTTVLSSPVGIGSLTNLVLDNVSSPTQIGASSWTQIAAGDLFTNALRYLDGGLFTWGYGINGRLGSGATTSRSSPVQVGSTSWLAVSTGGTENTVALTTAYTIFSWGRNNVGQVGDATTIDKSAPVTVGAALNTNLMTDMIKTITQVGASSWSQISAGDFHAYAIRSDSGLFAWGKNDQGQLGTNVSTTIHRSSPVQIGAGTWNVISAGNSFGAAITSAGNLQTTGLNDKGQLGSATITSRSNFAGVGSSSWTTVSAGATSMIGTTLSNLTFVWGTNTSGQLGLGDTQNRSSPVQLGSSLATSMYQTVYPSPVIVSTYSNTSWTQVNVGDSFAVGLDNAGRLFAWGLNSTGQLGDGTTINTIPTKSSPSQIATTASSFTFINTSSPVQVSAGTSWTAIAAGGTHTVAVKSDGTLWSWGTNLYGQIGNGSTINQIIPKQVDVQNSFTSVAAGTDFSTAINTNYSLWKWGYNSSTDITSPHRSNALQVGSDSWSIVRAGGNTAVGITTLGKLYGWGKITTDDGFAFNLGISPITWAVGSSYTQVNAGDSFIHAIDNTYGLWASGLNSTGQLGDNTVTTRSSAVQIGSLYSWSIVGGGIGGTPIGAGSLFLTGLNTSGQLGLSDLTTRSSPVQLPATTQPLFNFPVRIGISRWSAISAGYSHSMAIRDDNTLWAWGLNASGQLGDTSNISRSSPVQVGTSSWIAISAGKDHTGSVSLDNTLWTWGLNTRGQLGLSDTTNRSSPVQIGTGYWNNVSVGNSHTTALADNNTLYVWGDDSYGQ